MDGYAIACGCHSSWVVAGHLVEEAKIFFADGEEAALDFDQFPAAQFFQELIVLADDGDAQIFLLHGRGRDADGAQQEPRGLIEARHVHVGIHVGGEIVFGGQYGALERQNPVSHCVPRRISASGVETPEARAIIRHG